MVIKDDEHGFALKIFHIPEDPLNDSIDVLVTLAIGEKYSATFATAENVKTIMRRHESSGESLSGVYFWAAHLIIVRELTAETIHRVVVDMLQNGELFTAFRGPFDDPE